MANVTSVCVYCASSNRVDPAFLDGAARFGGILAEHSIRLVYGGGSLGLMGRCADGVMQAGGTVLGIIPEVLYHVEVHNGNLTELRVVPDMHSRKAMMFRESDAFVVLPGGVGTLDELIEVLCWRQLNIHSKPVIIVNQDGYWDPLLKLIDHVVAQKFAGEQTTEFYEVVDTVEDVLPKLASMPAGDESDQSFRI